MNVDVANAHRVRCCSLTAIRNRRWDHLQRWERREHLGATRRGSIETFEESGRARRLQACGSVTVLLSLPGFTLGTSVPLSFLWPRFDDGMQFSGREPGALSPSGSIRPL